MRFLLFCLVLELLLVAHAGQPSRTDTGVGLDPSGAPVAGAASTVTASDGTYELTLPAGPQQVQVSAQGSVTATVPL